MLNKDFVNAVKRAIQTTWGAIAPDAAEMCESNEEAMEMCLDADRMLTFGKDKAAYDLVTQAMTQCGYLPTLKFLAASIQLL